MQAKLTTISMREVLHFLGWRGTPVEPGLLARIDALCARVLAEVQPHVITKRFALQQDGALRGTSFLPAGCNIQNLLSPCGEVVLLAATLGVQSERILLREQARSPENALLLDAVLSAAIEAVCDDAESALRSRLFEEGMYLTDRFSPGYGDMPLDQSKEICAVLDTARAIGLTVSSSGIMLPRKSVTAVMGISLAPVQRRASRCALCSARQHCIMRRNEE